MKFVFKVGPGGSKGGFKQENNPATVSEAISKSALKLVREKAFENMRTQGWVDKKAKIIQKSIIEDLDIYAKQIVKFFFNQKSSVESISVKRGDKEYTKSNPSSKKPLLIHMTQFGLRDSTLRFKSGFSKTALGFEKETISWAPLSPNTIKKKKGNTTYFVDQGLLMEYMDSEFAGFLRMILRPRVTFTPPESVSRPDTAKITVSLLVSKRKGIVEGNLPFLRDAGAGESINDLISRPAKTNDLIRTYMNYLVARRLLNTGKGENRPMRSIVTPVIAWWVLSRFPVITARAFRKNIGKMSD